MAAAICNMSVDFPMPGSPPTSTTDPGTIPPPRTRSSSGIPQLIRGSADTSSSVIGTGRTALLAFGPEEREGVEISSTNVFHPSQFGHLPSQRAEAWPQAWQTYVDLSRFIRGRARNIERVLLTFNEGPGSTNSGEDQEIRPAPVLGEKVMQLHVNQVPPAGRLDVKRG